MMKLFRGIVFFVVLFTGVVSIFVALTLNILLIPLHSIRVIKFRRWMCDCMVGLYLDYAASALLYLGGTKVSVYSDEREIFNDKAPLLLSNHRTRVDWMYAGWVYCQMLRSNDKLRFILKDSLRAFPFFGWVMQQMMCIFLSRKRDNREAELSHIQSIVNYLLGSGGRPSLLLFPEGTDLAPEAIVKSHAFAKAHELPELNYVLYPRASGLVTVLSTMKESGAAVHDITIAYEDHIEGKRTSEISVFTGEFPKHIHLCVRRFELADIPVDKNLTDRWIRGSFHKKERLLKAFYENNSQVPTERLPSKDNADDFNDVWPPLLVSPTSSAKSFFIMMTCNAGLVGGIMYLASVRWMLMGLVVVCTVVKGLFNGFDVLELGLHGGMESLSGGGGAAAATVVVDKDGKKKSE
jgi:lysocardiolipin and lysophospholipid acyltransferase